MTPSIRTTILKRFHFMAPTIILTIVLAALLPTLPSVGRTQGFLAVNGTKIVTGSGETVLLRGINYPGIDDSPHTEVNYARFAQMGFNVVRLPISWAKLEPSPGTIDLAYLSEHVGREVQWARKHGVYIVLNIVQYKWGERFGGTGFPEWAVENYPATESGMREAVSNFWIDGALQNHFFKVWTEIARAYANEPTIAGYDILNEPWIYTSVIPYLDATYVDLLYMKTIKAIRTVDQIHMIFLEPANVISSNFPYKENIVWSPHFYPLAFSDYYSSKDGAKLETDLKAKYQKFVLEIKVPMWIGEFGAFMNDRASRDAWLADAIRLFEKYQLGWAWWPRSDADIRSIPSYLLVKATSSEVASNTATLDISSYNRQTVYTFIMGLVVGLIAGSLTVYVLYSKKARNAPKYDKLDH